MVSSMMAAWIHKQRARLRQALNSPAHSQWENLGRWLSPSQPYPEAARALAMTVAETANMQAGDRVLDLGPGMGQEQQRLWQREFQIGAYYGWERHLPAPPQVSWHHVLAVDSAYFVPHLQLLWQQLWLQLVPGGTITWTDLYLKRDPKNRRERWRLRMTSAMTGIRFDHWRTLDEWQTWSQNLVGASLATTDLTDEVLGGFCRHMAWRRTQGAARTGPLWPALLTAALLEPLLAQELIGYRCFCLRRDPSVATLPQDDS